MNRVVGWVGSWVANCVDSWVSGWGLQFVMFERAISVEVPEWAVE